MGLKKMANNYGYTMMELVIAVSMLLTISAVTVPNYTRYIASTREKVCIISRQNILYEYHLYCIHNPELTFTEYLRLYYQDDVNHFCPSGGIYTANGSGETVEFTCSEHADKIESGLELSLNDMSVNKDLPTFDMDPQIIQAVNKLTSMEVH
jgi:hypothetical protein